MTNPADKLSLLISSPKEEPVSYFKGVVQQTQGSKAYVLIDGGTSVWCDAMDVKALAGDRVRVEVRKRKATLIANYSHPVTDDARADSAYGMAEVAKKGADDAQKAADQAIEDAGLARQAAEQATRDAATAAEKADDATESARIAKDAAEQATEDAAIASEKADAATESAKEAKESADAATTAARDAVQQAGLANEAATDAQASARRADKHATDALNQLSVVEDVAGTLQWISDHGSYVQTTDTTVNEGVVYFELSDGSYIPITEPSGNPRAQGWYVLDVKSSQSEYIMAHLAVTSEGLWVIPSGVTYEVSRDDSVQKGTKYYELVDGEYVEVTASGDENPNESGWYVHSPRTSSGYKLLLSNDGAYLYDDAGRVVTTYGESIKLDSSRPQYIGGEDAYVLYYDSDNDGSPDSIMIGGSNVTIGGASLSEVTGSAFDLYYDHTFTVNEGIYTFNAHVYMGGEDVTRRCDPDFFVWWLRTESGDTFLGRGWSIDVDSALAGYNASVLGGVEDALEFVLSDSNDYEVVDSEEDNVGTYMTLAASARGPRE